jgi:hypothetical protein
MKKLLLCTALLALFLLAGCGSSNTTSDTVQSPSGPGAASNTAGSYLNDNQGTEVLYIQWTQSNGQLTGSWNDAVLKNGGGIAYANLPITGTYDSDTGSISLVRYNNNGSETPLSGLVQGSQLTLGTQQGTQFPSWTLHAAHMLDYRSALTAFQSQHPG